MTTELITSFLLGVIIGPILSLIVTPLFIYLRKVFYIPFARKKLLTQAIADGHVVTARLIKSHDIVRNVGDIGPISSGKELGVYQYEYKGKMYKYHGNSTNRLPNELTLYFIQNPRKACSENELGIRESNWGRYYLCISVALMVVIFTVGMCYIKSSSRSI